VRSLHVLRQTLAGCGQMEEAAEIDRQIETARGAVSR
jgi:hypothetical protein